MRKQKSDDPSYLFTLQFPLPDGLCIIDAWETKGGPSSHTRIEVEVRHSGVVFPRGSLWCGIPGNRSIDGIHAKECVLSLVAMKPGDTDRDYFADYTPEQLSWAEMYGEDVDIVAETRFRAADGSGKVVNRRRGRKATSAGPYPRTEEI